VLYEALSRDKVSITRYQDAGSSINKPRLYQPETCFQMWGEVLRDFEQPHDAEVVLMAAAGFVELLYDMR
jgi:hypothetical protein